jgi:hypothetical protein
VTLKLCGVMVATRRFTSAGIAPHSRNTLRIQESRFLRVGQEDSSVVMAKAAMRGAGSAGSSAVARSAWRHGATSSNMDRATKSANAVSM